MFEGTCEENRHQDDWKFRPLRFMDRNRIGMCELIPVTPVVFDFRLIKTSDDLIDLIDVFFRKKDIDDFADISVIDVFFRIIDELENLITAPVNPCPLFDFPFLWRFRIIDLLEDDVQFVNPDLSPVGRR